MRRMLTVVLTIAMLLAFQGISSGAPVEAVFRAKADPSQEVTEPPVESDGQARAVFKLGSDGTELHYRVTATRLEDVTMSHLHLAPAGQNGGVVVWLGDHRDAPLEDVNGLYVSGTITADDLVGALEGLSLSGLVEEIEAGRVYLNIHTLAYPGGEVRGQLF